MTLVSEKPCWEIMRCSGGDCVARRHPERPCWEHASALNFTASAHGVCADCIVFVAKQVPAVFSDRELTKILSHQKIYGLNRPKCPAQIVRRRLWPIASERRESARYQLRSRAKAVISSQQRGTGRILDLSHKGLAFIHQGPCAWLNQPIWMDIQGENFTLSRVPAQIVSVHPMADAAGDTRRCGVQFTNLSVPQRDMLEQIIRQHGQSEFLAAAAAYC